MEELHHQAVPLLIFSSTEQARQGTVLLQPLSSGAWSSAFCGIDMVGDPAAQDMGDYDNFLHGS